MLKSEIPPYEYYMKPILEVLAGGQTVNTNELLRDVAKKCKFSEDDINIKYPTNDKSIIFDRAHWAKTYLQKAGLVEYPERGKVRITQRGAEALKQVKPINVSYLALFDEFKLFKTRTKKTNSEPEIDKKDIGTPEELIAQGSEKLKEVLIDEIHNKLKTCSPTFFENLVVDLLLAMGYGGSLKDAGKALGRTGDGGVDGVIKEDKLGLDVVYIQAKRWEGTVGRPVVQAFAGSLQGYKANKGVLITTSQFSADAIDYVKSIHTRIVLIDGDLLAELMMEHNVGTQTVIKYEIKKIDEDYFEEIL
jgi:restriction system protein